MRRVVKYLVLFSIMLFLLYLTFFNVKVAYSCYVSDFCESSAEYQCNAFCKNECEGVMLISRWCCSGWCCSLWYMVCINGNWGRYTCFNDDLWACATQPK